MLGATLGCGQGLPRARATLQPSGRPELKAGLQDVQEHRGLVPRSSARQDQAPTCGGHSRWKEGVPIREEGSLSVPQ